MANILFYFFSCALVVASFMSISMSHPVHAVLSLIVAFMSAACLFLMIGAEYLGASTIIVYVGAVAVLFLFVVMMLNNDKISSKKPQTSNKLGLLAMVAAAAVIYYFTTAFNNSPSFLPTPESLAIDKDSNTLAIGKILYTEYFLPFQVSGLILLLAMVGAIMLTLRHNKPTKRQDVNKQIQREKAVKLVNPTTGKGVKL